MMIHRSYTAHAAVYKETITKKQPVLTGGEELNNSFGDALRSVRMDKGLSQQQLAQQMFVDRSSIANWEAGRRLPDASTIARLCECLGVDTTVLLSAADHPDEVPIVIMVDDEKIILGGGIPILQQVMPQAEIIGFSKPSDAIEFAKQKKIAVAFLDIEMGRISGLELSRELLRINPQTNIYFLTAYLDYAFEAWQTGACGFIKKPITVDEVRYQLTMLRHPVRGLT